ncbi:DUF3558 domain-containing protein [Streptomyces sp. NPDC048156]|uniref:DUF3558 domain-containing protein n=1 Tax=Streptomyces sp. NPDC048156 TaxID=3365502 RepID=UPI0037231BE8
MHRPTKRLTRIFVCAAAVPVILVASGCSSDSDSGDGAGKGSSKASASASDAAAKVKAAAYDSLPQPCAAISKKTLDDLVPEAKSGKAGASDDEAVRGTCSWSSLDNKGVKGSQFRWLNASLMRFDSDAARGSGNKLAHAYFTKQVTDAQSVDGAKSPKSQPVSGTGDEATAVTYELKKKEGTFKQQTVVARVENVVITIDYNGAGLAGEKTPGADELVKDAEKAAKEAVAAVLSANGAGGSDQAGSASAKPSDKASDKASSKPSDKPSGKTSDKPSEKSSATTSAKPSDEPSDKASSKS